MRAGGEDSQARRAGREDRQGGQAVRAWRAGEEGHAMVADSEDRQRTHH